MSLARLHILLPQRKPHHAMPPSAVDNLLFPSTKRPQDGHFRAGYPQVGNKLVPAEAAFIAVAHVLQHRVIAGELSIVVRLRLHIVAPCGRAVIAQPIQKELAKDNDQGELAKAPGNTPAKRWKGIDKKSMPSRKGVEWRLGKGSGPMTSQK